MSCVAIIPARGGSRRIPRKNIKMFHGKPIIAYSIEAAKESGLFDEIWVSSEDHEIGSLSMQLGAKWHPRSKELSEDGIGTQLVMAGVLSELWPGAYNRPEYACCIYATAPLLDVSSLQFAKYELDCDDKCEYAFSVGCNPLQDAGQFYFGKTRAFLAGVPLVWPSSKMIPIKDDLVCDINTMDDWNRAEQMYSKLHGLTVDGVPVVSGDSFSGSIKEAMDISNRVTALQEKK